MIPCLNPLSSTVGQPVIQQMPGKFMIQSDLLSELKRVNLAVLEIES